jgi:hypothetical protein
MIRNIHPAEELFELRAEIRALKAREAELRAYFLSGARGPDRRGPFHEVAVTRQRHRVLARDRLPAAILHSPRYWREEITPVVTLLRREPLPQCHGLAAPDAAFLSVMAPDDTLFEPFD